MIAHHIERKSGSSAYARLGCYILDIKHPADDRAFDRLAGYVVDRVGGGHRVPIKVGSYFEGLEDYWRDFLTSKSASMQIDCQLDQTAILAHEIDLDSVFYNLIVNSVEAFTRPSDSTIRHIQIEAILDGGNIIVTYRDTGPGLSPNLKQGDDIFAFGVSSKANDETGQPTGTGIGMWIVKTIVQDWGGEVTLHSGIGQPSFKLTMTMPAHTSSQGPAT